MLASRSRPLVYLCVAATFVLSFVVLFWHRDSIGEIHVGDKLWHSQEHDPEFQVEPEHEQQQQQQEQQQEQEHEQDKDDYEEDDFELVEPAPRTDKLHYLLPASNKNINLCKTLLTGTILDYPRPTLIGWDQKFDKGDLLGGGSHVIKISGVLERLEAMDESLDNDLVFMMDAYDAWFQLPRQIMVNRYYDTIDESNRRLHERLGRAMKKEGVTQSIIFGAGKRCSPNERHTVACYAIPESPLPTDLYGGNTDTTLGPNPWWTTRQRFLNSGYIIGPVKDMRAMFRRALEKVEASKEDERWEWDDGSGQSDHMYHGSDQSIFSTMYGEQEFQREAMRRRHLTADQRLRGEAKPNTTWIEGVPVDDPLNPSFTHQHIDEKEGTADDFGITLDFYSTLIQQTVNSNGDVRYLTYSKPLREQIGRRILFDCQPRLNGTLPADVLDTQLGHGAEQVKWADIPLYTNVCLDQVPVLIHHNGNKGAREGEWKKPWMQVRARQMLDSVQSDQPDAGGAWVEGKGALSWRELCPAEEMDKELFRVEEEEEEKKKAEEAKKKKEMEEEEKRRKEDEERKKKAEEEAKKQAEKQMFHDEEHKETES